MMIYVFRGGGWFYSARFCRSAYIEYVRRGGSWYCHSAFRLSNVSGEPYSDLGFRPAFRLKKIKR